MSGSSYLEARRSYALLQAADQAHRECEHLGYDGQKAIEALPKLLITLQVVADGWAELSSGDERDIYGAVCAAEAQQALAKIKSPTPAGEDAGHSSEVEPDECQ